MTGKPSLTRLPTNWARTQKPWEKDVWVCWTLEKLVAMPKIPDLAFKGGTSLSKAYDV
jgi:hypothetical protein